MSELSIHSGGVALTALVDRAASVLNGARNSAEILEASEMASLAYDAAKRAARLGKAKKAHDDLISAVYRAQADALEIEAQAKRRLADEYDAAQERGEVATLSDGRRSSKTEDLKPTTADLGLTHKDIHEARIIRDAEIADPGIVRRTVDAAIAAGEEPSKAKVRRAVLETARPDTSRPSPSRGKDAIRERVREAVTALSGLPRATEVAEYFRDHDSAIIITERVETAASWLSEFAEAWSDGEC
jgi:hypothetical protein